jgi:hypothetical protein
MLPAHADLAAFAARWGVARLWLFGSLATGHAAPTSDADILVEFLPAATTSTWDWPAMQDELAQLFHRPIDLLSVGILSNPARARSVLASRKLLYTA